MDLRIDVRGVQKEEQKMEFELNKKDEQFLNYLCGLPVDELLGVFRILNVKLGDPAPGEEHVATAALICEAIEVFHGLPRKPRRQLLKLLKEATS